MDAKDLENDVADHGWGLPNENGKTDFFRHISEGQRPDSRQPSPWGLGWEDTKRITWGLSARLNSSGHI